MTFWTRLSKVLFPKRSAKMIDDREKRKCHLAFELQSSLVFEKRSNLIVEKWKKRELEKAKWEQSSHAHDLWDERGRSPKPGASTARHGVFTYHVFKNGFGANFGYFIIPQTSQQNL